MTLVGGALAVGVGVAALVLALRPRTAVEGRLALLAPLRSMHWRPVGGRDLAQSGLALTHEAVLAAKLVAALVAALSCALVGLAVPLGPLPVVACLYAGFVAPSLFVERRAAARRERAERRVGLFVEWLEALVSAGRPPEAAVAGLAARGAGAPILDGALRTAAAAYALGAPLFGAVAVEAEAAGLPTLVALARQLDRSRDLGRGSLVSLREQRDTLRARERAQALDAASRVEGRLMLVLVLCYLPALMLLVVVPLFAGALRGLELAAP